MTNEGKTNKHLGKSLLLSLLAAWLVSCAPSVTNAPPTVIPTVAPTLAPLPTPVLPGILNALSRVPQGQGAPEAGIYEPDGPTPPHLVIMDPSGEGHEYGDHICVPLEWQPVSLSDTELVVVLSEYEVELGTQTYIGGPSITRYRFEHRIEIREARSGKLVQTNILQGTEPEPFPAVAPVSQTRLEGGHVGFMPVLLHLQETLCRMPGQYPSAMVPLRTPNIPLIALSPIALSPDEQVLATEARIEGGYSPQRSVVHLWQVTDGMLLQALEHGNPPLLMAAFSPDGQMLATLSEDGQVRLWKVSDGGLLYTLEGYRVQDPLLRPKGLHLLAFSPDGQILATLSEDQSTWLWQAADGGLVHKLERQRFIGFSPDGQMLATANGDGIQIWRVTDWQPLRTLPQPGFLSSVNSYATFSPDNQYLASMAPGDLQLWRLSDGKALLQFRPTGPEGLLTFVFSADGKKLALLGSGKVRLWQTSDGALLGEWDSGAGRGEAFQLKFSPDGQFLASVLPGEYSNMRRVQLWRVSDGEQILTLDGNGVIFSPDGQFLLIEAFDLSILRTADGELVRRLGRDGAILLNDRLALLSDCGGVQFGVVKNEQWALCHIDPWSRAISR